MNMKIIKCLDIFKLFLTFFFSGFLDFELDLSRFWIIQSWEVIEEVSDESEVELLNSLDDIGRRHERSALDFVGLVKGSLSSFGQVLALESLLVDSRIFGSDLIDQMGICFRIPDIVGKVVDSLVSASLGKECSSFYIHVALLKGKL